MVADADDEHIAAQPVVTFYLPIQRFGFAGRLFARTTRDPHTLIPTVTRTIREIAADQPIERAATLEEGARRTAVAGSRQRAHVSGFAGVTLLIAVVGIAGVLAFSVSAHARVRRAAGGGLFSSGTAYTRAVAGDEDRPHRIGAGAAAASCCRAWRRDSSRGCSCRDR
jgi:hypothetical protein